MDECEDKIDGSVIAEVSSEWAVPPPIDEDEAEADAADDDEHEDELDRGERSIDESIDAGDCCLFALCCCCCCCPARDEDEDDDDELTID